MEMRRKNIAKGQATTMIVLGLVILIAIILIYFTQINSEVFGSIGLSLNQVETEEYIEDCITLYAEQGLTLIKSQGGYIKIPENNLENIGYFYYNEQLITLDDISSDLENYVEEKLIDCPVFESQYKIEKSEPAVEIKFKETEMQINVIFPLKFTDEETSFEFEEFSEKIPTTFKLIFDYLETIDLTQVDYNNQYYFNENINVTTISNKMLFLENQNTHFLTAIKK